MRAGQETEPCRGDMPEQDTTKVHGIHYTPTELSNFVAEQLLIRLSPEARCSVLDPACGEGNLLVAVARQAESRQMGKLTIVGVDRDPRALKRAEEGLRRLPYKFRLIEGDFLEQTGGSRSRQVSLLTGNGESKLGDESFDAVIVNPPYVRTQVLGAFRARELARSYGLSGRVDLYHVFVRALTSCLRPGGVLALLCSNRFLYTQGGMSLRLLLKSEYELQSIWDLGDTKLFRAAVLPAVVVAAKRTSEQQRDAVFVRVYEDRGGRAAYPPERSSVIEALRRGIDGRIRTSEASYMIESGILGSSHHAQPWVLLTPRNQRWLQRVAEHSWRTFGDVAKIRVGIKSTADDVFIRGNWDSLPSDIRPEPELLHDLLTADVADRWRPRKGNAPSQVLYPYTVRGGRRVPVDLAKYPRAAAYFEFHRARLESRSYVLEARRKWFEIWVPQQPGDWKGPKVVFPDISETPRFFLDESGAIVNGECYWIPLTGDLAGDAGLVLMAVANSSFALTFYDMVCGNRLYAGRRRFITQYVKRFPLPKMDGRYWPTIADHVRVLLRADSPPDRVEHESELDSLVWASFGVAEEGSR